MPCPRNCANITSRTIQRSPRKILAFHTGLLAFDYHRFPVPPYVGNGWHLELVQPPTELPIGAGVVGDECYPAKEVLVRATAGRSQARPRRPRRPQACARSAERHAMRTLEGQGMSYRAIARELNRLNIRTGRGCQWYDVTVKAALQHGSQTNEHAA